MAAAANFQASNQARCSFSHEELEDSVSGDLMTRAVTVVPCGHIFNEDTVIKLLASGNLCPLDRRPIDQHVPNYMIRSFAERANQGLSGSQEEIIGEEAQRHFLRGKELADSGDKEKAIPALLKALQLSPTYEKAQGYLEFCLGVSSRHLPPSRSSKDEYSDLLVRLLENPLVEQDPDLMAILEAQLDDLMSMSSPALNQKASEMYQWIQKLLVDGKISRYVAKKLPQIHQRPQLSQPVLVPSQMPISSALEKELRDFIEKNAFGKIQWMKYFGGVGVEPLPPLDIQETLNLPCPFWKDKKIGETHRLIFIPQTVGGHPLTLKSLGELIQNPRTGSSSRYSSFDLGSYPDNPATTGRWTLITLDPVPGTEGKSLLEQQAFLEKCSQKFEMTYEVSHVLDTTIALCMEQLTTSLKLTYSRCQEAYSSSQQIGVFVLKDKSVAIKVEAPTVSYPVVPIFLEVPHPPSDPLKPQPFVFPPFPLYVDPPQPLEYQKARAKIYELELALDKSRLEDKRAPYNWKDDDAIQRYEKRLRDKEKELSDNLNVARASDVIRSYSEDCCKKKLAHQKERKKHYEDQSKALFSISRPYADLPKPIDYQEAQKRIRKLKIDVESREITNSNRSDRAYAYLKEAEEGLGKAQNFYRDSIKSYYKSNLDQRRKYYETQIEMQSSAFLLPPQDLKFSGFYGSGVTPKPVDYQEAQKKISELQQKGYDGFRLDRCLKDINGSYAIRSYNEDAPRNKSAYDEDKRAYEIHERDLRIAYDLLCEQHIEEHKIQFQVRQALYEKKKEEYGLFYKNIQKPYEIHQKEYEEDQRAFANIGIRAQRIF